MLDADEREGSSRGRSWTFCWSSWGVDDAPFGAEERRLALQRM